ncbi:hypothetical protein TNCV_3321861 [Trichonephila clavipes]|nr:hypothetical protein TNCV_3321861 [Trichonephila clavipes]
MTWRNPPARHWYAAKSPGLSIQCRSSRARQAALARLRSGHLRSMTFSAGRVCLSFGNPGKFMQGGETVQSKLSSFLQTTFYTISDSGPCHVAACIITGDLTSEIVTPYMS